MIVKVYWKVTQAPYGLCLLFVDKRDRLPTDEIEDISQVFASGESSNSESPMQVSYYLCLLWDEHVFIYIACTAIFQPVAATPQSCWRLCTRFAFFWKSYVSCAYLRLLCFILAYVYLYFMYCHFSASCSHPPILLIALSPKPILLRLLCESCLPETPVCVCVCVFCYWQMLIKFYIACTAIFQPVAATPQSSCQS